jgi:hypothetical protein
MLWTIAVVLVILWLLGLVTGYTMGSFIVPFGDWEKNPRLQAKTSVCMRHPHCNFYKTEIFRMLVFSLNPINSTGIQTAIKATGFSR